MATEVLDENYLALVGIVTVGLQFIGYLIAYGLQVDKVRNLCRDPAMKTHSSIL